MDFAGEERGLAVGGTVLKSNGYVWDAAEDFAEILLEKIAPNVDRLEALAESQVIKTNSGRTILRLGRVRSGGENVVIKLHRARDWKESLKYIFVRSRARAERDALERLERMGIPCPRPLAMGERRIMGFLKAACLVLEHIPNDGSLLEVLKGNRLSGERRRSLLAKLASMVCAMHDRGFDHRDLNAGNLLVGKQAARGGELWLLDCHRVRLVRRMGLRGRVRGLAGAVAGVGSVTTRADRCRMVKRYLAEWGDIRSRAAERRFFEILARRMERLRRVHHRSRTRRCLQDGREFAREKTREGVVYRRREYPVSAVLQAIRLHRDALRRRGDEFLKDDVKTAVTDVSPEGGGRAVCVKEFKRRGLVVGVARRLSGSKGRRAWRAANGLVVMGVGTPLPLACVEDRRGSIAVQVSYLITESAKGYEPLSDFLGDSKRDALLRRNGEAREKLIDAMASLLSEMHAAGAYHRDFRPGNLLARWDGRRWDLLVVDLEDVELNHFPSRRERLASFVRLLGQSGMGNEADCVRFLEVYKRRHRDVNVARYWTGIAAALGHGEGAP